MKHRVLLILCLSMLLFGCDSYQKDNQRLSDELKAVREENSYLKAQIVGQQKQIDEMKAKAKEEREGLEKKFQEERDELHKKVQEEREAMQKKAQEAAKKKSGTTQKDQKETAAPKNSSTRGPDNKVQKKPPVE
jgi:predicted  nucleic acid-binding Zn-ribbon protein